MIKFDVGAHWGTSSLGWAAAGDVVYAFEPTPQLAKGLRERSAKLPDYHVIEAAVSSVPGRRQFNVAGWEDWGCSSLRPRAPFSKIAYPGTWPHRQEFPVTETPEVEVIRLDTFMRRYEIGAVEYLHCDAQGEDLEVLRSLGERIADVRGGCIEIATTAEMITYEGQATLAEAITFLNAHGFIVEHQQNGGCVHEQNVYFRRS